MKIAGIGEIVLDIVLRDGQPQAAVPGGSVFNSMISLGRTAGRDIPGLKLTMASHTGDDPVSSIVTSFMKENGVDTDGIVKSKGQSTVSLAMLDSGGNAQYEFFRDNGLPAFVAPATVFSPGDILMFGSIFAVSPDTGAQTREYVARAREAGAIVYYDVNYRVNHGISTADVEANIALCDIVRASSEDIANLYGSDDAEKVYKEHIAPLCKNFICTRGSEPADLFSPGVHCRQPILQIGKPVSTIGAGDNFNAGIVWSIVHNGFGKADLQAVTEEMWHKLAAPAMQFSANVCMSVFNYVDKDFRVCVPESRCDR